MNYKYKMHVITFLSYILNRTLILLYYTLFTFVMFLLPVLIHSSAEFSSPLLIKRSFFIMTAFTFADLLEVNDSFIHKSEKMYIQVNMIVLINITTNI